MVQNAFMKAWMALDGFRGDAQLSTWLFQIVTYEALGLLRKNKNERNARIEVNDDNAYLLDNAVAHISIDGKETEAKLERAIEQLPDKQKLVFKLRYYEEMPYNKMSKLTDTSEGALKASYHHAVKKVEEFVLSED
ncbi:RNA polymerase sigma factor [Falsiporphyromonas endometrii]|uniref:RNA polymerase sigma factor n=1 Tax=Falsiporphyromonas endometrii TaxID=1387297 RepID=A0ABV9K8Q4_9PORP